MTTASLLLALAAGQVLGWIVTVPIALRRRMLQVICSLCLWPMPESGDGKHDSELHIKARWRGGSGEWKRGQRGALYGRYPVDVAWAIWVAFWWLPWLVGTATVRAALLVGRGVFWGANRVTPLTAPELQRVTQEQAREIARLMKVIEEGDRK
jgi:hypothetical protein